MRKESLVVTNMQKNIAGLCSSPRLYRMLWCLSACFGFTAATLLFWFILTALISFFSAQKSSGKPAGHYLLSTKQQTKLITNILQLKSQIFLPGVDGDQNRAKRRVNIGLVFKMIFYTPVSAGCVNGQLLAIQFFNLTGGIMMVLCLQPVSAAPK